VAVGKVEDAADNVVYRLIRKARSHLAQEDNETLVTVDAHRVRGLLARNLEEIQMRIIIQERQLTIEYRRRTTAVVAKAEDLIMPTRGRSSIFTISLPTMTETRPMLHTKSNQ